MKRIILLLFVSMLMAGSAFAVCVFTIEDFTVTPDQIGTEIALTVKAEFSARVNAWQVDFTYPEGLTPTNAEPGADFNISYINSNGGTAINTPLFVHPDDYSRVIAVTNEYGFWYDPDAGDYANYGTIKWEGGTYEEMFILYVEVTEDFHGGQIIMTTECSSSYDPRAGTVRENGDHGVSFTSECNVMLESPEAYTCYTPENTTLTFYYDNQRSTREGIIYDLNTGDNKPGWEDDNGYVTEVVFDPSFAAARPTTTFYWFNFMINLESITGLSNLNTSEVTNMEGMFSNCWGLTSLDVSSFNTDKVTDMGYMFYGCKGLTSLDLSSFNTSQVTNMNLMFYGCLELMSLDLSSFNTSKLSTMSCLFSGCKKLTSLDLSSFNTAYVTNMSEMFYNCPGLTSLDVSSFNTARVTDMSAMFYDCKGLTSLDVSNFNTANVTNMGGMFSGCGHLTSLDLSNFNTSKVTNMGSMFSGCGRLTSLDVSSFNTSNVMNMSSMFSDCFSLTSLDLSCFNTANVIGMDKMFLGCGHLTSLDLRSFNTANVTEMNYMFNSCSNLATVYVGSKWSTAAVTSSAVMFYNCTSLVGGQGTTYDDNHTDKAYAHIDGGPSNPGYFTGLEAYALYTPENQTLTFYYDSERITREGTTYDLNEEKNKPGWYNDGTCDDVTKVVFDPSFANARPTTTYRWFFDMIHLQSITGMSYLNTSEVTDMTFMFGSCLGLTSLDVSGFNTDKVTNMSFMFSGCSGLTSLDVSNFNTSKVTIMNDMFHSCRHLTSLDVSNFNTSMVGYMSGMFSGCSGLTSLDVSNFNTSDVTDMSYMFEDCSGLTSLDLSSFNTTYVTDMSYMFTGCRGLTSLDLSNFNTARVTSMLSMFRHCVSLTSLDVSNFNTAKVTNMKYMFLHCLSLTSLNLGNFNTAKVTNMYYMFYGCTNLSTIYVDSGWSTAAVNNSSDMFYNCTSLVGGMGTTYDSNYIDASYAHIDGGSSNPGYFTGIEAYALYTPGNQTLTFYYDSERSSRVGTTYDLNTNQNTPDWYKDNTSANVRRVVFNPSFAKARPTTTSNWFYNMANLQDIYGMNYLNTSEVTTMHAMFRGCTSLTSVDLSDFSIASVTSTTYMFWNCTNLTTIYCSSDWRGQISAYASMFKNCTSLVGGQGTTYDNSNTGESYAHVDGGPSDPGYFTDKNAIQRGDVNHDGLVNVTDVTNLISMLISGNNTGNPAADVNNDGLVNVTDATILISMLIGS